ncbi:MAG: hypothetical protein CFE32_04605 [Alphaproteobacteria bacterium PA3]|nr:MAG: hypothetical protein CFE32_04605 [Alphaproteobacteria bacterium PA3]
MWLIVTCERDRRVPTFWAWKHTHAEKDSELPVDFSAMRRGAQRVQFGTISASRGFMEVEEMT